MSDKKFTFTYDIYTGDQKIVFPNIGEMILGIGIAIETDNPIVYAGIGNDDNKDDFMEYGLDSDYIQRLRHSPEYHNAVLRYLVNCPSYYHFRDAESRTRNFGQFREVMTDYGVLGVISPYPEDFQKDFERVESITLVKRVYRLNGKLLDTECVDYPLDMRVITARQIFGALKKHDETSAFFDLPDREPAAKVCAAISKWLGRQRNSTERAALQVGEVYDHATDTIEMTYSIRWQDEI